MWYLWPIAKHMAAEPYNVTAWEEKYSTGGTCWMAICPALPGCMAQGNSRQEAIDELADARVDYIWAMLSMGLPVRRPD